MKYYMNRAFLFLIMFICSVMICMAQNIGKIAILPFNGGTQDENDGIAELFSFTSPIMNNFTVIPRTNITQAINKEQSFQSSSGMTNAETMARLGNQFGANYVMAGSITSLGNSRLLIVSIVKIDVIQQVAGAFLQYNSLDDFNKDETKISKMASELVALTKKDTDKMDKLAIIPVQFSGGANENDGDVLAQLLSAYLIQNGNYAVYPRTKDLDQVQNEYKTQRSGITSDSETVSLGRGINPPYVLSIASRRIGTVTRFNASIIALEGGNQISGESEPYTVLSDGINAMKSLAVKLSKTQASKLEREQRMASIGKVAILPINGGTQDERDGIAELFSFTPQIMGNLTVIPRTTITQAVNKEQSFQSSSGMTDADTMARLGNQFGANYVMAGTITSLGDSKLLIVSIVKIDVIQQVAGAFLQYNSLDELNKDSTIIGKMAEKLITLMKKNTSKMDKLAVLPVQFSDDVNEQDGDALAQLLSIYLIQNSKYAIYPRTKTLEQIQNEYSTQMSGKTRDSEVISLGRGINPPYVLSIASRKIGSTNRFNASVIDLEKGSQVVGGTEPYTTLSDGINAMDFLAKQLSGIQVSKQEREKRSASIANTASAEERARQKEENERQRRETENEKIRQREENERQRREAENEKARQKEAKEIEAKYKRQAANDKFKKNASFNYGGWIGLSFYPPSTEDSTEDTSIFLRGGGEIGLNLSRYFGLQTGFEIFQDVDNSHSAPINTQTLIQIPFLATVEIDIGKDKYYCLSPYAGAGINIFSIDDDTTIQSYSQFFFIVGLRLYIMKFAFMDFHYNRDFSETIYKINSKNFRYTGERFILSMGIRMRKSFR